DEHAASAGAAPTAHSRTEVRGLDHSVRPGQHVARLRGELGAPLATAGREDGAAGAGAHTEAEAVLLGTTPVVRLEGSLAHGDISWPRCAATGKERGGRLLNADNLLKIGPRPET